MGVRRVARVIQTARVASPDWEPGFKVLELVAVQLEPDPSNAYE